MITLSGIRNAMWFLVAFGIVACAATAMPVDNPPVTGSSEERAGTAQAAEPARSEELDAQSQAARAEAERLRLAAQLDILQARQTERGIVMTLHDVTFYKGRVELKSGGGKSLDQIVAFLNEYPERSVQVESFSARGSNDVNLELSQTRADAVAMALLQRGIDAQRVRAIGYGESQHLSRRVEIIVSNEQQAIPGRTATGSS